MYDLKPTDAHGRQTERIFIYFLHGENNILFSPSDARAHGENNILFSPPQMRSIFLHSHKFALKIRAQNFRSKTSLINFRS
jgi:hypothetical protein